MAGRHRRVELPLFVAGLATAALLVVMLYYPVASVLAEAVLVDGRPSPAPVRFGYDELAGNLEGWVEEWARQVAG